MSRLKPQMINHILEVDVMRETRERVMRHGANEPKDVQLQPFISFIAVMPSH
jgi:hypothetical protein